MRTNWLICLSLSAAAPLAGQSSVRVGVEFGYTSASFAGKDGQGFDHRSGATGSAFLDFRLTQPLRLTVGPALTARGGTAALSGGPGNLALVDLVTIDLPVLLRARVPLGNFGLLVEAGGAPGVRIGCNVEVQQGNIPVSQTSCGDLSAQGVATMSSWDVGAIAGIGIGVPVAGSELGLKVRYSRGFIPVIESLDLYNRSVSVLLTLPF